MISGYTVTRDCISNDYCFEECILSMIPFCDEVVVGDAMSTDGTRERLELLSKETGKIRIVDCERRENIFDEKDFICKWVNYVRERLMFDYQFYLDADEVASPNIGNALLRGEKGGNSLWFSRLNFIKDTETLIPVGRVCADRVIRAGPTTMFMPMDCPGLHPREVEWATNPAESGEVIFHYGFLREKSAYYRKCKFLHNALVGSHDNRLNVAEETGIPWTDLITFDVPCGKFSGKHPDIGSNWLRERGYNPNTK